MNCKCGAKDYDEHLEKVAEGYPGHIYKGTRGAWSASEESK